MTDGTKLVEIGESEGPLPDSPHRIVINFPDDHDINGMKIEIAGVTPEQMMLAVFYIERSANQVADARQMQADMQRREMERISAELRKGH